MLLVAHHKRDSCLLLKKSCIWVFFFSLPMLLLLLHFVSFLSTSYSLVVVVVLLVRNRKVSLLIFIRIQFTKLFLGYKTTLLLGVRIKQKILHVVSWIRILTVCAKYITVYQKDANYLDNRWILSLCLAFLPPDYSVAVSDDLIQCKYCSHVRLWRF